MNNKKKNSSFIIVVFLLIFAIVSGTWYVVHANYISSADPNVVSAVAKWSIKVNDEDLTTEKKTLQSNLVLTLSDNEHVADGKIAPGRSGYFNIEIDPTDTEVSINYSINIDEDALDDKFGDVVISGYKVNNGTLISASNISGSIDLNSSSEKLSDSDKVLLSVYVTWNDENNNSNDTEIGLSTSENIEIPVSVVLSQKTS